MPIEAEAMTDQRRPLCLDLFCSYGGWARGFLDAGYRVIGFDIEPKCAAKYPGEFILADVSKLDGFRFKQATVIVASPPCQGFSVARRDKTGRPNDHDWESVDAAFRVIRESGVRFWAVENVRGAWSWFAPRYGDLRYRSRPYYLWGNFPGFILQPPPSKGFRASSWQVKRFGRRFYGKADLYPKAERSFLRAIIPYPLARALAEACKP